MYVTVPTNLLGEKYMLGIEPSWHAIAAAVPILLFVLCNGLAAPAIEADNSTWHLLCAYYACMHACIEV